MYRMKMRNRRKDRRKFSKSADSVHPKNFTAAPRRGGTRL